MYSWYSLASGFVFKTVSRCVAQAVLTRVVILLALPAFQVLGVVCTTAPDLKKFQQTPLTMFSSALLKYLTRHLKHYKLGVVSLPVIPALRWLRQEDFVKLKYTNS